MPATHPALTRRSHRRDTPQIPLIADSKELQLSCGRLHEACGPARRTLALWLAGQMTGHVLWILPAWCRDRLNADGMAGWADPGRFLFVEALRADDVLWSMEEALRSGAVSLVIGDLPGLPGLTQVRRMHLAAENGGKAGPHMPLGLILTPDQGGAQGVESRWHLAPDHAAHPGQWHLTRLRARTAPQAEWHLRQTPKKAPLQVKAA